MDRLLRDSIGKLYTRRINFHFIPVVNVDGYEYSRLKVDLFFVKVDKLRACAIFPFRPTRGFGAKIAIPTQPTRVLRPDASAST